MGVRRDRSPTRCEPIRHLRGGGPKAGPQHRSGKLVPIESRGDTGVEPVIDLCEVHDFARCSATRRAPREKRMLTVFNRTTIRLDVNNRATRLVESVEVTEFGSR